MNICVELNKTLIEEDQTEFKKKCFLIAKDIESGRLAILQLIEELKEFLVNPSPSKREQGVLILTQVLRNLTQDFLNVQQLQIISVFYQERLSDHHQIVPTALKGILKLMEFKHFPDEVVRSILSTIFQHVACQQQQQADRYTIYEIFQLSLKKYKDALISMELDLVYGIISSIDGERDPRNLLFLFKWLKTFIISIPLGHLTEEMFEVMACYFPVDFKTPPSDTMNITREDLATELCPCLCAIPQFAQYSIPLALEKLESSLQIAKLDSLHLLRQGCSVFEPASYLLHGTEIWSQLQKEVFGDVEDEIKMECLNTLTVIINKMSESGTEAFISILSNIVVTLKGNLIPDSKLFQPSINILLHTALGSQQSSIYIVKEIVPLLTNTFAISREPLQRVLLLKTLTQFTKAYLKHNKDNIFSVNEQLAVVPMLCLKACTEMENSLRSAGFESVANLADILPLDVRLAVYEILHSVIIKPEPADLRMSILNCFKTLSISYPQEIDNYVLYKSKIPDESVLDLYLNAVCFIADNIYFRGIVSDCLITYAVDDVNFAIVAIKNMTNLLVTQKNNRELLEVFVKKNVFDKLIEYVITKIPYSNDTIKLLLNISSVLKILIGSQSVAVQNEIIQHQLKVIENCRSSEELYIFLLDGLISRTRKGFSPDGSMLALLTKLSTSNSNDVVRDCSNQLLANLINKHPDGSDFNECLNSVKRDCLCSIDNCRSNVIITLSWITKALVMRNHAEAISWIDMLLQYLEEDSGVAEGFRIIMNDNYESLSLASHCDRKFLYQQKFFILVTNKICDNFSKGKESYLIALGFLIEYVSEQALLLQFKKISRLVILCLEQCNHPEVLCVLLKRIKSMVVSDESLFQENLEDFLMRILKLARYVESMNVRIAALRCIIQFSLLPLHRILPFKQTVLHHLESCIDDKKRLVRKAATEARNLWYLLDAPM